MRVSLIFAALGEALLVGGVARWSLAAAMVLAGVQLVALALVREVGA